MTSPHDLLSFALAKYPESVEVVPVAELLTDSARQNDRRPAYLTLAVPDEVVKGLRGPDSEREALFLVRVPREVAGRSESRIILPREAGR